MRVGQEYHRSADVIIFTASCQEAHVIYCTLSGDVNFSHLVKVMIARVLLFFHL